MTTAFQEPYAEIFDVISGGDMAPLWHKLGPGVHTLMVTWEDPAPLTINRTTTQSVSTRVPVGKIPAGTGRRTLMIPGVSVKSGETAYLNLNTTSAGVVGSRATVQVITIPLKAAGGG